MAASRHGASMGTRVARCLAAVLFTVCLYYGPAFADDPPVLMRADEIIHDEARNLVTVRGNIEISQDNRILQADEVVYDIQANTVTASGRVILHEPTGEVVHASLVVLENRLRDGIIENLRMVLYRRLTRCRAPGQPPGRGQQDHGECRLFPVPAVQGGLRSAAAVADQGRKHDP